MAITKIASSSLEENQQNYINILRSGQSITDTGWTTYADAAAVNPVDGLGGTASITWSQNTSSPLSGDVDLRLAKGATNRQGDGISVPFTIANRHLAKVLQITFDMELISGTYSSGDLRVSIIQDPTGTPVMLEPVGTTIELGIANQRMREIATFQTHVSITSYRLCIHVSSTSASAYTVDFANFKIWEQQQSVGAVITDWQSYTPTIQGNSGGTLTSFYWRRVGSNLEINGRGTLGTTSSSLFQFSLPNGFAIGSINSVANTQIGIMNSADATSSTYKQWILLGTSGNTFIQMCHGGDGMNIGSTNLLTPVNINNIPSSTPISLQASIPIAGWGSNVAMSSDTGDGRVVAATITGSLNTGASPTVNLTWSSATIINDTHSAFNSTTGYTAPVSGFYQFNANFNTDSGTGQAWNAWVSGSNRQACGFAISGFVFISGIVFLLAGQNLTFRPNATGGNVGAVGSGNYFTISRVSAGSQIIASSEFVGCRYSITSSPTATSTFANLIMPVRSYDSHGSYNTSTGVYTVPMSGKYLMNVSLLTNVNGSTSGFGVLIRKNGSQELLTNQIPRSVTSDLFTPNVTHIADFLSGDTIEFRFAAYSSNVSLQSSLNSMSITRLGL